MAIVNTWAKNKTYKLNLIFINCDNEESNILVYGIQRWDGMGNLKRKIYKVVFNADIKRYEWYHKTTDIFNITKNKGWFFQLKGSEKKIEKAKEAITAHFNLTYSKFI